MAPPPPRKPKLEPKRPERAPLAGLVREVRRTTRGPDVVVRFDTPGPTPAALKALGSADPRAQRLARYLAKQGPEIARRVHDDRALAALLVNDPASALVELGVPAELVASVDSAAHAELLRTVCGVRFDLTNVVTAAAVTPGTVTPGTVTPGTVTPGTVTPGTTTATTTAEVQLLADTFASVHGDAAKEAALRADPAAFVLAAATAHPPQGVPVGSPAAASIVRDVTDQIRAAGTAGGVSTGNGRDPWAAPLNKNLTLAEIQEVRIPVPRSY